MTVHATQTRNQTHILGLAYNPPLSCMQTPIVLHIGVATTNINGHSGPMGV